MRLIRLPQGTNAGASSTTVIDYPLPSGYRLVAVEAYTQLASTGVRCSDKITIGLLLGEAAIASKGAGVLYNASGPNFTLREGFCSPKRNCKWVGDIPADTNNDRHLVVAFQGVVGVSTLCNCNIILAAGGEVVNGGNPSPEPEPWDTGEYTWAVVAGGAGVTPVAFRPAANQEWLVWYLTGSHNDASARNSKWIVTNGSTSTVRQPVSLAQNTTLSFAIDGLGYQTPGPSIPFKLTYDYYASFNATSLDAAAAITLAGLVTKRWAI